MFLPIFPKMFVLKIVTDFASAHSLRDYPGDCSRLHGHNWQVEMMIAARKLNSDGIVIDFRDIKKQTKIVVKRLDHQYLNEIAPFDKLNPTAENLAKYFFDEVGQLINTGDVKVKEVTIWETQRTSVTYSQGDL